MMIPPEKDEGQDMPYASDAATGVLDDVWPRTKEGDSRSELLHVFWKYYNVTKR